MEEAYLLSAHRLNRYKYDKVCYILTWSDRTWEYAYVDYDNKLAHFVKKKAKRDYIYSELIGLAIFE